MVLLVAALFSFYAGAIGGFDSGLVSEGWVSRGFNALSDSVEAYNWSARGSTHIPTPQDETAEVGVPWFRCFRVSSCRHVLYSL